MSVKPSNDQAGWGGQQPKSSVSLTYLRPTLRAERRALSSWVMLIPALYLSSSIW